MAEKLFSQVAPVSKFYHKGYSHHSFPLQFQAKDSITAHRGERYGSRRPPSSSMTVFQSSPPRAVQHEQADPSRITSTPLNLLDTPPFENKEPCSTTQEQRKRGSLKAKSVLELCSWSSACWGSVLFVDAYDGQGYWRGEKNLSTAPMQSKHTPRTYKHADQVAAGNIHVKQISRKWIFWLCICYALPG